jgi:DNA invertase Pin-like site-specific DNA recombinase
MKKAVAYLRVSGKGQIDGDGFPRQLAAVKAYAETNGIEIVKVFREEGVTGTSESMDRPAWSALMASLDESGIQTVLIERLDRLARDLMIQEAAIANLRRNGLTLISAMEPDLMANDATRVLVRQMLGAVAQYDKSQIVSKLRGARMRKRLQDGRCEGRKPFGHTEAERKTLDLMCQLWSQHGSLTAVCRHLEGAGIRTRAGHATWHPYTVSEIIKRSQVSMTARAAA